MKSQPCAPKLINPGEMQPETNHGTLLPPTPAQVVEGGLAWRFTLQTTVWGSRLAWMVRRWWEGGGVLILTPIASL